MNKNYNKMFGKGDDKDAPKHRGLRTHTTVIDEAIPASIKEDINKNPNMDGAQANVMINNAVVPWPDSKGHDGMTPNVVIVDDPLLNANPPKEPKTAKVISSGKLNVRKTPGKDGTVLCLINPGSKLLVEGVNDGWAHVYTESGIEGYVMSEFIKED
jgi:hypothetical protein